MDTEEDLGDLRSSNNRYFKRTCKMAKRHLDTFDLDMLSHHAAIIVKGGRILSSGTNNKKRNKFVHLHYAHYSGFHAESAAIYRALHEHKTDLKDAVVYVVRVRKDGSVANSKPCKHCQKLLTKYGVRRALYSNDIGGMEMMRLNQKD